MPQIPKLAVTTMVPLVYDIAQFHYSSSSDGSGADREIVAISDQDILSLCDISVAKPSIISELIGRYDPDRNVQETAVCSC
jgi:hypothetical protein